MREPILGQDYLVDYYALLSVSRDAEPAQVTAAYRQLQKEWHPDRYSGLAEEMQAAAARRSALLNEADAVLGDPSRRAEYDLTLAAWTGPLSKDGTPIVDLERGSIQGLLHRDEESERRADEMAFAMSGFSPDTLALLESLLREQEAAGAEPAAALRQGYAEALERQAVYLAVVESLRLEQVGLAGEERIGSDYAEIAAARAEEWRTTTAADIANLALEGGEQLALESGRALELASSEAGVPELLQARLDEFSAELVELGRKRGEVAEKRLELKEGRYLPEGAPGPRRPRVALGIDFGETTHWLSFRLDGLAANPDPETDLSGLPESAAALVEAEVSVLVFSHAEGLAVDEEIAYVLDKHFSPLVA
jgi:curved DNA-binding protein CbpA